MERALEHAKGAEERAREEREIEEATRRQEEEQLRAARQRLQSEEGQQAAQAIWTPPVGLNRRTSYDRYGPSLGRAARTSFWTCQRCQNAETKRSPQRTHLAATTSFSLVELAKELANLTVLG